MVSKTARQIINSVKSHSSSVPRRGATKLGSAGYDNIRDDINLSLVQVGGT